MNIEISADIQQTYDIIEEIGSGGGTVYKAYHKRLQKYVVLKKIHSNVKKVVNIRTETDILKNLHHYYLPQVLDFLEIKMMSIPLWISSPVSLLNSYSKKGTNFPENRF